MSDRNGRRRPMLVAGAGLLAMLVAVAILGPLIAAHRPDAIAAAALERPSARHWLGTDVPGRDIFAQVVYGARASLVVAVVAATLALAGALLLGVVPALVGDRVDAFFGRLGIFLLALPGLPLLILIGSLAGRSRLALVAVIAFLGVAPNARILRSQTLSLRQRGYISTAQGFGGGPLYVLRRHLVPSLAPLIAVGFANWAGMAIALEAGLAFLGLGDPTSASWGLMIDRALSQPTIYFSAMWTWWVLPAGLAITLSVLGFTLVGVGLEPAFNPRWNRGA